MLNEDRVILMTKMASFEDHAGKKNSSVGGYFRGDYIGMQVLKSIISATIAFLLVFAVYVFYNFETFMTDIYQMDLLAFGKRVLQWYVAIVVIYAILSYIVYAYRYSRVRRNLRLYQANLKKLAAMYHNKERE